SLQRQCSVAFASCKGFEGGQRFFAPQTLREHLHLACHYGTNLCRISHELLRRTQRAGGPSGQSLCSSECVVAYGVCRQKRVGEAKLDGGFRIERFTECKQCERARMADTRGQQGARCGFW